LNSRKYKPWSVPPIVTQIIAYLDAKGLEAEGIFRLSGQASELVALREKIDRGEDVDFNVEVQQPHVVAALLKLWLRELPEPLLTFKLYTTFINTCMQRTRPR
jgi:Rho GTPase-activating protein 1